MRMTIVLASVLLALPAPAADSFAKRIFGPPEEFRVFTQSEGALTQPPTSTFNGMAPYFGPPRAILRNGEFARPLFGGPPPQGVNGLPTGYFGDRPSAVPATHPTSTLIPLDQSNSP